MTPTLLFLFRVVLSIGGLSCSYLIIALDFIFLWRISLELWEGLYWICRLRLAMQPVSQYWFCLVWTCQPSAVFFDLFLQCFEWSPKGSFISLTRFIPRVLFLKYCKWDFSYLWFLGFVHKEGSLMAWPALKGLIISHWTFSQHLTREATLQDPRFVSFSYANYNYAILIFPKTPNRLKSPQCNLP